MFTICRVRSASSAQQRGGPGRDNATTPSYDTPRGVVKESYDPVRGGVVNEAYDLGRGVVKESYEGGLAVKERLLVNGSAHSENNRTKVRWGGAHNLPEILRVLKNSFFVQFYM